MSGPNSKVADLAHRLHAQGAMVSMGDDGVTTIHVRAGAKARRKTGPDLGHNIGQQLKSIIERVERLEEEKRAIGSDIRDIYTEAKGNGLDPKILRRIVAMRRQDPAERREAEAVLESYLNALGMA